MPHRLVRLAVMACLLGAVTPSPKGDGGHAARSDGKRTAPSSPRKREGASHPTVPRSRLHATTQPVAATPSRPSVQSGRAKAEAGAGAGAKAKAASLGAPTEDADLSSSERAALIGGLLLAPAGIGGFLLGCSLGGGGVLLYEKVSKGVQDALSEFKAKHQHEIEGGFRSFEQYAQLTEITVKAPSEELALAYKARLTDVLSQPHNRRCFDCSHCEDEMAVWASINLGVFVCERCAGMHRALGTHKSRIKSAYADVWTVEMIERMEALGNERARELYGEAGRVRVSKDVDAEVLEVHVRDKYSKIKPAPGPLPSASGKLYRCEPVAGEAATADAGAQAAPVAAAARASARQPALASASAAASSLRPRPPKTAAARTDLPASARSKRSKTMAATGSKAKASKLGGAEGPLAKKPKPKTPSSSPSPSAAR
ncbi:hypothetical protein KFE25_006300 [Diacronema lutheri]|uniref:Arf-GAP domain-containing protein n=2 Tax=Diacronema lutheri TaxID=2081491 RepID=A0A8J5XXQ7_DIALT|nr:hypothetical protein KFE25_006300 [Diacronema lutheri]